MSITQDNYTDPSTLDMEAENLELPVVEEETEKTPEIEAVNETSIANTEPAAQANEWQERFLRLSAEFDNFRKRTNREKDSLLKFAGESLIKSLLPTLDDLSRALRAAETSDNLEAIRQGLGLITKNFNSALQKQGVEEIATKGEPFDSELHEAIASMPAPEEHLKGKVLEEIEKGYRYQGKVVRYAKVITGE